MYSILFINLFIFYRLYYIYRIKKNCGQPTKKNKYLIGAGLSLFLSVLLFLLIGDYLVIPGFISILGFVWFEKRIVKKSKIQERKD